MDTSIVPVSSTGNFLPITVVVAIGIFVSKELLEANRRRAANVRRRRAIRRLISDEIERNNWTISKLRECISEIEEYSKSEGIILIINTGNFGEQYFQRRDENSTASFQLVIGKVHSAALDANLLALAEVDKKVFDDALEANDAMKELDHVLRSLIKFVSEKADPDFLEGFTEYARREILKSEEILSKFYKKITGIKLENRRIR